MVDDAHTADFVIVNRSQGKRHIVINGHHFAPEVDIDVTIDADLERELAELQNRISIQATNLADELSFTIETVDVESVMKKAEIALKRVEEQLKAKEMAISAASEAQDGRNR